ncbi:MAG: RNA polymerase sigma factor [Anaeromyxobacteraceae bacterium]
MAPDPDAALFLAFQRGDAAAFRTLYERHARAMVAFCFHHVRDAARAEELAQDVFVKLHRARDSYRPTARFKTFLYRIAANHCLNELRRGEWRAQAADRAAGQDGPSDPDTLPSGNAAPDASAEAAKLEAAVRALLDRLPEKQRTAFVLARFEGLSYHEIADVLETTVAAVKSLVHRATVAATTALAPFAAGEVAAEEVPS